MITLLLMAGRSKRFWPLSDKCLWRIADRSLIEHQVERLRRAGCRDIVLVGGKHNLKEAKVLLPGLRTIEQRDLELGMRGALLAALPRCKNESVLVVSANDFIEPSACRGVIDHLKRSKADGVLLARSMKQYFPGGYLTVKGKRITGIVEKPGVGREPSSLVNIVVHAHRSASLLLDALKRTSSKPDDGYEQAVNALCREKKYEIARYQGSWLPVKYPWHLLSLLPTLLAEIRTPFIHRTAQVHSSAAIDGPVILSKNVRVLPHATIRGPCFIGEGTMIGSNALVRDSSIGGNCVIGYASEIARSSLGDDVWTHSSYVGDSLIDCNVALGGGTITGNFRLDEGEISSVVGGEAIPTGFKKFGTAIGAGCRLGIHVSLSPGVKIGSGSFVNSATLVSEDIPDGSFVKMKGEALDVRPNRMWTGKAAARNQFQNTLNT